MDARGTINGKPVTEEQIEDWAAEAEAGYEVAQLKKRCRGRAGLGAEPSRVVALRLTSEQLASIDAQAAREGKTRSEIIREALAAIAARKSTIPHSSTASFLRTPSKQRLGRSGSKTSKKATPLDN